MRNISILSSFLLILQITKIKHREALDNRSGVIRANRVFLSSRVMKITLTIFHIGIIEHTQNIKINELIKVA